MGPHLSLCCSFRGFCHHSLGGLTACETVHAWCLKGFTRCAGNNLQEKDDTSCWGQQRTFQLHPWVPVTQHPQALQLCSGATVSHRHLISAGVGRRSSTSRPGLEHAFRESSPGKCQGHPPCSVASSKQLILCRRQLQGREMLMLCMSLLLLQP